VDILTPKQARFFQPLIKQLGIKRYETLVTTRDYDQVTQMLDLLGYTAKIVGKHGGGTLKGKLIADSERIIDLTRVVSDFNPDMVTSFVSPTALRVAFGLAIPSICVSDSPHAEAVSRLTLPLTTLLYSPDFIPLSAWTKYNITSDKIKQYHALDPIVWLRDFKPSPDILKELNLDLKKPILTARIEEAFAAYLLKKADHNRPRLLEVLQTLHQNYPDLQIVALPRYGGQAKALQDAFGDGIRVTSRVVDGTSLISYSTLFIGAGGTMTAEAVLLGTPSISFFHGSLHVEDYMVKHGLLQRATNSKNAIGIASNILSNPDESKAEAKSSARKFREEMDDPIKTIVEGIEELLHK
jgi:predicted glycosyltransferase